MKIERRLAAMSLRSAGEGAPPKITGYAAVFNQLSDDLGGFRERIAPGAFAAALTRSDVRALFNHDPNFVLGRVSAGTLVLREDETGLTVEITPPDSQTVRDLVLAPMARGDINQQSFGFTTRQDRWDKIAGEWQRTLLEIGELFDVSPVTFPAYPQTDAALRAAGFEIATIAPPPNGPSRDLLQRSLEIARRL